MIPENVQDTSDEGHWRGWVTRELRRLAVLVQGGGKDLGGSDDEGVSEGITQDDADDRYLQISNDLSDVGSTSTARTNLGLGTAATSDTGDFLQPANNLSDVISASTSRTNLGLGSASLLDQADVLQASNNLSDLNSASSARSNLGLGLRVSSDSTNASAVLSLSVPTGFLHDRGFMVYFAYTVEYSSSLLKDSKFGALSVTDTGAVIGFGAGTRIHVNQTFTDSSSDTHTDDIPLPNITDTGSITLLGSYQTLWNEGGVALFQAKKTVSGSKLASVELRFSGHDAYDMRAQLVQT